MKKDKRYKAVKHLIEIGQILKFREVFDFIPTSIVYKHVGVNYFRFKNMITKPKLLTIEELYIMASFFEVEIKQLLAIVFNQIDERK